VSRGPARRASAQRFGQVPSNIHRLFLLRRLLGVKTDDKKRTNVAKLVKGELLLINFGSMLPGGCVLSVPEDLAKNH